MKQKPLEFPTGHRLFGMHVCLACGRILGKQSDIMTCNDDCWAWHSCITDAQEALMEHENPMLYLEDLGDGRPVKRWGKVLAVAAANGAFEEIDIAEAGKPHCGLASDYLADGVIDGDGKPFDELLGWYCRIFAVNVKLGNIVGAITVHAYFEWRVHQLAAKHRQSKTA